MPVEFGGHMSLFRFGFRSDLVVVADSWGLMMNEQNQRLVLNAQEMQLKGILWSPRACDAAGEQCMCARLQELSAISFLAMAEIARIIPI